MQTLGCQYQPQKCTRNTKECASLCSNIGLFEGLEWWRWTFLDLARERIAEFDSIFLERGSGSPMYIHECPRVRRFCSNLSFACGGDIPLAQYDVVRRGYSCLEFRLFSVQNLLCQLQRFIRCFDLRFSLREANHRLADFKFDLLVQPLQAYFELILLQACS